MPVSDMVDRCTVTSNFFPTIPSEKQITKNVIDYITNNWNDISEKIWDAEARKEQSQLLTRQRTNKYYRSFVKHVHWSGDTCIVYWNDGTQTKARWNSNETFDPEKAILVCMARKLYGDTNIYNEVLKKYENDGWNHYDKNNLIYKECTNLMPDDLNFSDLLDKMARGSD